MSVALDYQKGDEPALVKHRVAMAFLFAMETAMRCSEICKITGAGVTGRVALIPTTKNGRARKVPLSPVALELLADLPDQEKLFDLKAGSCSSTFYDACKNKTTINDLTFHDSRHEATTRLADKLHVLDLARVTGHTDIKQLMTYYNKSTEDIAGILHE